MWRLLTVLIFAITMENARTAQFQCFAGDATVVCDASDSNMPGIDRLNSAVDDVRKELATAKNETEIYRKERQENEEKKKKQTDSQFRKVTRMLKGLDTKLTDLNDKFTKMRCHVRTSDGVCYFVIVHAKQDMMYEEALSRCHNENADVAAVPDKEAYDLLMENLRRKIPFKQNGVAIWIGMKINPKTGKILNSVKHSYAKWSDGFPHLVDDIQGDVLLYASTEKKHEGMQNVDAYTFLNGIVCQRND